MSFSKIDFDSFKGMAGIKTTPGIVERIEELERKVKLLIEQQAGEQG